MKLLTSVSALLLAAATAVSAHDGHSHVIDLTPKNFDEVVINSGKPTLVKFFAPWCGHCKTLAPIYDTLAENFLPYASKVNIAKVDADAHNALGKKYGIKGFPTLKWFPGNGKDPIDYTKGRDIESLTTFITSHTSLKPKSAKAAKSDVKTLTDATFDSIVKKDKDVIVKFYAPWCGHCKTLAPIYENLATDYARDNNIVVAKIDCDSPTGKKTSEKFGIQGFPTLKFFPAGSNEPVDYDGARTEEALLAFINEKAGTHRTVGGGLDDNAGTIEVLDNLLSGGYSVKDGIAAALTELAVAAKALKDVYAPYYVKVAEKLGAKTTYVEDEIERLAKLVKKGGLAPQTLDDFTIKSNILKKFLPSKTEEAEPSVQAKEDL